MQKLYCYVDETGQDTEGDFFLVVVLVTSKETTSQLEAQLEHIETQSGKRKLKWHKTRPERREAYLRRVAQLDALQESIFYGSFSDTTDYLTCTAEVLISSIQTKATPPYQATIVIDALKDAEQTKIRQRMKQSRISYRSIRGLRDESSALIRLCDGVFQHMEMPLVLWSLGFQACGSASDLLRLQEAEPPRQWGHGSYPSSRAWSTESGSNVTACPAVMISST